MCRYLLLYVLKVRCNMIIGQCACLRIQSYILSHDQFSPINSINDDDGAILSIQYTPAFAATWMST